MQRRLKMLKIREVIRLTRDAGLSQNQIAMALGLSKGSVNQTLRRFNTSTVA